MNSTDTSSVTFLQESEDGRSRCNSQTGRQLDLFGPEVAPASHFPAPESSAEQRTSDTCGRSSSISSASAALSSFLASRLQAQLATDGSTEYRQTWKERVTPAGRRYWAHTARAAPTSDNAFTGWPTPKAMETVSLLGTRNTENFKPGMTLTDAAILSGWPTPRAEDSESTGAHNGRPDTLTAAGRIAGWATPTARDYKDGDCNLDLNPVNARLGRQVLLSSPAQTGKRGALNPALSRWLMGYPVEWCQAAIRASRMLKTQQKRGKCVSAATETPSSHKPPPPSSQQHST